MKSSVVAPKRRAIAASPMTSPAFTSSMETPTTRRVGPSSTILITPRVSRIALALGFSPDHIPGGPDMGDVGAQHAIHAHGSLLVQLHTRLLQADLLRIGASPSGYQELFC